MGSGNHRRDRKRHLSDVQPGSKRLKYEVRDSSGRITLSSDRGSLLRLKQGVMTEAQKDGCIELVHESYKYTEHLGNYLRRTGLSPDVVNPFGPYERVYNPDGTVRDAKAASEMHVL